MRELESPLIDLERHEWRRVVKQITKWIYEPPIHWKAVPPVLLTVALVFWLTAWRDVRRHEFDPGRLWFLYPTEWDWSYLTALL
jgi:hypothetical protein